MEKVRYLLIVIYTLAILAAIYLIMIAASNVLVEWTTILLKVVFLTATPLD